jgi:hypothetical protein
MFMSVPALGMGAFCALFCREFTASWAGSQTKRRIEKNAVTKWKKNETDRRVCGEIKVFQAALA